MGVSEPVVERENDDVEREAAKHIEDQKEEDAEVVRDMERGEVAGLQTQAPATRINPPDQFRMSRLQRLSATNPLRLVINAATRVPTVSPSQPRVTSSSAQPLPNPSPQVLSLNHDD